MPKLTMTNREFYALVNDINQISGGSPALRLFLRGKIEHFTKSNQMQIRIMNERILSMQQQYCIFENGKAVSKNDIDGNPKLQYRETVDLQRHTKALEEYMSKTLSIEIQ